MSCNCNHTDKGQGFACLCDGFVHPLPLEIGMGLSDIPRQMAGFPEFRKAMLFSIRPKDALEKNKLALNDWKARQPDDHGVMLLEMWAYICDALSFYDKAIAQEMYLRTAFRRPSLRKMVALLGYRPRPAIGSSVYLTAEAEGRLLLKIPAGTSFRSEGFDGNPPQVFELDQDCFVHPLTNGWNIKPFRSQVIEHSDPAQLSILTRIEIKAGSILLLRDAGADHHTQVLSIEKIDAYTGLDGKQYRKISFGSSTLTKSYPLSKLELLMPLHTAGLWTTIAGTTKPSIPDDHASIVLDGLYREIKSGQYIIIRRNKECRWYLVKQVEEESRKMSAGEQILINSVAFETPGIATPVTRLFLDQPLNHPDRKQLAAQSWTDPLKAELTVYYTMQAAGEIVNDQNKLLNDSHPLLLKEKAEEPMDGFAPRIFFLTDINSRSKKINASIDYINSLLTPAAYETWNPGLVMPVKVHGNILNATRGETVSDETLGSGDASVINQTYKLKKKPLTYFSAPALANDQGIENTLKVYVNGIRWKEVSTFFNKQPDDEIYIVRQDDEGDSLISFGDGRRGKRLPSGSNNIVASYRFGAEQAAPPAAKITQVTKPVEKLTGVNNPVAATGGADAETAEGVRTQAPKSILTLGRIVSIQDVEAVALTVAGVRAVQVEWRWQNERQSPMIHAWYIGAEGVGENLNRRLRSLADPTLFIHAAMATAVNSTLVLDLETDPRYREQAVLDELRNVLTNTKSGLLAPEHVGIGKPFFRSKIFAAALSVAGIIAVRSIRLNGTALLEFVRSPGAGKYFDFEKGQIQLNQNS